MLNYTTLRCIKEGYFVWKHNVLHETEFPPYIFTWNIQKVPLAVYIYLLCMLSLLPLLCIFTFLSETFFLQLCLCVMHHIFMLCHVFQACALASVLCRECVVLTTEEFESSTKKYLAHKIKITMTTDLLFCCPAWPHPWPGPYPGHHIPPPSPVSPQSWSLLHSLIFPLVSISSILAPASSSSASLSSPLVTSTWMVLHFWHKSLVLSFLLSLLFLPPASRLNNHLSLVGTALLITFNWWVILLSHFTALSLLLINSLSFTNPLLFGMVYYPLDYNFPWPHAFYH